MVIVSVPFVQPVKFTSPMSVIWSSSVVTMSASTPAEPVHGGDLAGVELVAVQRRGRVAADEIERLHVGDRRTGEVDRPGILEPDRVGAGAAIDRLAGIDLAAAQVAEVSSPPPPFSVSAPSPPVMKSTELPLPLIVSFWSEPTSVFTRRAGALDRDRVVGAPVEEGDARQVDAGAAHDRACTFRRRRPATSVILPVPIWSPSRIAVVAVDVEVQLLHVPDRRRPEVDRAGDHGMQRSDRRRSLAPPSIVGRRRRARLEPHDMSSPAPQSMWSDAARVPE